MSYNTDIQNNNANLQSILDAVNNLPEAGSGEALPELTNPASAVDIAADKEAIDADGNVVVGTVAVVDGEYYMRDCDVYDMDGNVYIETFPQEDLLVRSGSSVIAAIPLDDFGDATAADVAAGKTFTSAAGLKETGTATGSNDNEIDALIDGTITSIENERVTKINRYAFYYCKSLMHVDLPNVTVIGINAFNACTNLETVKMASVEIVNNYVFQGCSVLCFVDLSAATKINNAAFTGCSYLEALIIRTGSVCALASTGAFSSSAIASGTGFVYVPSALVDEYKAATNWSTYADQIRAIEDYPDICGG